MASQAQTALALALPNNAASVESPVLLEITDGGRHDLGPAQPEKKPGSEGRPLAPGQSVTPETTAIESFFRPNS